MLLVIIDYWWLLIPEIIFCCLDVVRWGVHDAVDVRSFPEACRRLTQFLTITDHQPVWWNRCLGDEPQKLFHQ